MAAFTNHGLWQISFACSFAFFLSFTFAFSSAFSTSLRCTFDSCFKTLQFGFVASFCLGRFLSAFGCFGFIPCSWRL